MILLDFIGLILIIELLGFFLFVFGVNFESELINVICFGFVDCWCVGNNIVVCKVEIFLEGGGEVRGVEDEVEVVFGGCVVFV